jgi:transposase-like protein
VLQLCSYPVIGWPDASPGLFGCGLFKWRQFEPKVILLVVGWYLRFSLVLRVADKLSEKLQKKVDRRTL